MNDEGQGMGGAETTNGGSTENTTATVDFRTEIDSLKASLLERDAKIDQLISVLGQQQQTQHKPVDYNELVKTDIGAAINLAVDNRSKQVETVIKAELAKREYDQKVEKEFPTINSDKAFRDATFAEMQELINGGMSKNSPALVYKAAQIAASKHYVKRTSQGAGGMTGEAPRSSLSGNTASKSDKKFDMWVSMLGIKDKEGMRAKIEAHKNRGESK